MMDIKVFTLALYPTLRHIHFLLESAERYDIDVHPYHIPGWRYDGWFMIKVVHMQEALQSLDSKYVLYTDGNDSIFTDSLARIVDHYSLLGKPPLLCAASRNALNDTFLDRDLSAHYPEAPTPYRYPHAGGYIGERLYMIDVFERMKNAYPECADDAFSWHDSWVEGWFRPEIDHQCQIFQAGCRDTALPDLAVVHGRLYNKVTNTFPCVLHLNGGYSSQENGKDDRLGPWFERLQV